MRTDSYSSPGRALQAPSSEGKSRRVTPSFIAFGAALAFGGTVPKFAVGLGGVTIFAAVVIAAVVAGKESRPPLELMPALTAGSLAWSAGLLFAFASATRTLRRDREEGIHQLATARGATESAYVVARVLGLAAALFALVGVGVILTGLTSVLAAGEASLAFASLQATLASLLYAAAFASILAPLSLAFLGARTHATGYFSLLMLIVLPELLLEGTKTLFPEPWGELASIPSALAALRGSLMPEHLDAERFLRAFSVILVIAAISLVSVVRQSARLDITPALERR